MQIMRPMNKRDKINQIVKGTRNEFKELLEKDLGVWLKIVFGTFFCRPTGCSGLPINTTEGKTKTQDM